MQINVKVGDFRTETADAIIFGIFEGEPLVSVAQAADTATDGAITELIDAGDFKGEHKQTALLYTRGAITASRIALVGLGKNGDLNPEKVRQAAGKVVQELRDLGAENHRGLVAAGNPTRDSTGRRRSQPTRTLPIQPAQNAGTRQGQEYLTPSPSS